MSIDSWDGVFREIYVNALKIKLQQAGLNYTAEKELNVIFEDVIVGNSDAIFSSKIK